MSTLSDVTIIGGGIIGLMTAYECIKAGARVTVLDKSGIGQESSWAGGGILLPLYPWRQPAAITQLVLQSLTLYPALTEKLHNASGIDPEFLSSGLFIPKNPDIDAALAWCTEHNVNHQQHMPLALQESVTTALENPLWLPDICQVRNPRLLQALHFYLKAKGVQFISDCELLELQCQASQIQAILTSTGRHVVNQVILTTGAWTGRLWQQLFATSPRPKPDVYPVKGQMILFEAKPETLSAMVLDGGHYLIPRRDGKILVGSTVEDADFDKGTDASTKAQLTAFAQQLLPELRHFPVIKQWAGLRPGTAQGIPYITRHPELNNLSLSAGHFRNGFAMAPASAQLLLDLLLNRTPKLSPEPYQYPLALS